MARILDCWELGNGLAYIESMAVGDKLMAKAGHEVHFVGRDLTHAERLFGDRIKYHQAPTPVIPHNQSQLLPNPMTFADVLINLGYGSPGAIAGRVRAWRNLFDLLKPDLVRCAHAPDALLAARGTGMRVLVIGIGFLVPPVSSPLPLLRTWATNANPERMAAREQQVLAGMNQALDLIKAPRIASIGALYAETDERLLFTYPELDDYGPREGVRYVGNFQAGAGEAPVWPAAPGKRIFAYLEPFKPMAGVLQALAASGQSVLVYMPHAPEEMTRPYVSGNLRITSKPLDLNRTAQECDLGVSHGGHNIVGTLLYAGKPQLALPTLFPERITGEKIAALGAGLVTSADPAAFNTQLQRLLQEESFAGQARECAARIAGLSMEAGIKEFLATVERLSKAGPRRA